jgi:NADPH:quinone reductase-like Zn-dependent oxidoreductase
VIATGGNVSELEEMKEIGADLVIPFAMDAQHSSGSQESEEALKRTFSDGIDIVVDYLWGKTAETMLSALVKTIEDHPVRFVHVGAASGETNIALPGGVLRSAAITLLGSGIGSISRKGLVQSIANIFDAIGPAELKNRHQGRASYQYRKRLRKSQRQTAHRLTAFGPSGTHGNALRVSLKPGVSDLTDVSIAGSLPVEVAWIISVSGVIKYPPLLSPTTTPISLGI